MRQDDMLAIRNMEVDHLREEIARYQRLLQSAEDELLERIREGAAEVQELRDELAVVRSHLSPTR